MIGMGTGVFRYEGFDPREHFDSYYNTSSQGATAPKGLTIFGHPQNSILSKP